MGPCVEEAVKSGATSPILSDMVWLLSSGALRPVVDPGTRIAFAGAYSLLPCTESSFASNQSNETFGWL